MNKIDSRTIVFRIPDAMKTDFKIALLQNHVKMQNTFEAFCEFLVAHQRGDKDDNTMKRILMRARVLDGSAL